MQANIPRFIKLVSSLPFSLEDMRQWSKVVADHAPPGISCSIPFNRNGETVQTRIIKRTAANRYELIIPISRDLTQAEVDKIANGWFAINNNGGFSVEANQPQHTKAIAKARNIGITKDEYDNLSQQLAKVQHDSWVREKTGDGWSYGILLSLENKTHPMLRPWEQLPDEYKEVDGYGPDNFLNVLNNQGYAVVKQSEIDSLLRLLRTVS